VAFVVPAEGGPRDGDLLLAELRRRARDTLADYKAPDRIVVVDGLPLTSMMKVDKRDLAARAAALGPRRVAVADEPGHDRRQPTNGARAS
jgi:non-ribosomal peptide synthetase component E (peptide arylation enzyme)